MPETPPVVVFFVAIMVAFIMLVLIGVASDLTYVFNHALGMLSTNTSAPGYTIASATVSLTNTAFIIAFIAFIAVIAIVIMYRKRV